MMAVTARRMLGTLLIAAALPATAGLAASPALRLEAEAGLGNTGAPLQERVGSGPAWINRVPAASQGREVMIAGQDGAVRFTLPRTLSAGPYTVAITGYGQAFDGAPILAVLVNGTEKNRVTLTWAARATASLRGIPLKPGDVLELRFVNDAYGGEGKDRNAVLDYVQLSPESASPNARSAPASTPTPAKAPTVKAPAPTVKATAPAAKAAPATAPGTVNVRSFGATGNGKTDDTAALNRAMASGAATVVFPEGQYMVSTPVIVTGSKRLIRADGNAQLVAAASFRSGAGQQRGLLWLQGVRDVTVQGLGIDGRKADIPAQDDTRFIHGVYVTDSAGVTLSRLTVTNTVADGIAVLNSSTLITEDNVLKGFGRHGIWTKSVKGQIHRRNILTGLGNRGRDDSQREGGGIGLLATLGENFQAIGNTIRQTSDDGSKTEGVSHVVYRDNTIDTFGKDGIKVMPYPPQVTAVSDVVFENNTVSNQRYWRPDGSGYLLFQSVVGGRITGNTVQGSAGDGEPPQEDAVRVNTYGGGPPSSGITVEANTLRDTRRGIRIIGPGTVVKNNTVTGRAPWARSGIIVSASGVVLSGNTVDGPVIGVLIDADITGTLIENNTFSHHEQVAVYADNNNQGTTIVRNRFGEGIGRAVAGAVPAGETCQGNVGGSCP